ncbi:hypothetical protein [Tropicibacter sp. S64]|uniref:hypothetical protein n=1 Tax=Tropicibacter sp. S64 TaxID=3415122 RepID=UPI003C7AF02B
MPRVDLRSAIAEKEERDGDICRSCSASADPEWEPYCFQCGSYWRDVDDGLFADQEFEH